MCTNNICLWADPEEGGGCTGGEDPHPLENQRVAIGFFGNSGTDHLKKKSDQLFLKGGPYSIL